MTNAEKYLKEGIDCGEFVTEFEKFALSKPEWEHLSKRGLLALFLEKQRKPILTEDERVILRNMKVKGSIAEYIQRVKNTGYLQVYARCGVVGANFANIDIYSHLFQFIKERRRILN